MPTSSQAMIVMNGDGEDPRIPRRHFPASAAKISVKSYEMGRSVNYNSKSYMTYSSKALRPQGFLSIPRFDINYTRVYELAEGGQVSVRTIINDTGLQNDDKNSHRSRAPPKLKTQSNTCQQQSGLEKLGFRRKRVGNTGQTTLVQIKPATSSSVSYLNNAKYVPTPPGSRAETVEDFLRKHGIYLREKEEPKSETEPISEGKTLHQQEPKLSLLDDVKRKVNYDKRMLPAMNMRRSLPPSNPLAVCLSFREGDDFTHKEVKDILEEKLGLKVCSLRYDPVSVRSPDTAADTRSRWVITYATPSDCEHAVNRGLELGGDKIAIKFLDDVYRCEYEAFQIYVEDLRKEEAARNTRKPRKGRNLKRRH